ncbi:MAG: AAA family ATPase [Pseudomonadota bacterium]
MKWSPQQDGALLKAAEWLANSDQPVFRIFGYAGTGKTTLARHLAEGVKGHVAFGAYTGKAAMMMRKNGVPDAGTIHSMIYHHELDPKSGTFKSTLDDHGVAASADLIVIDECSMVDETIGADLLSFGKPILVLGDPAQLPPVKGGGFFTNHDPDVMLTEIHRQAADNPIIAMATTIREGGRPSHGTYGDSKIIPRSSVTEEDIMKADQVLVGTHAKRATYNARMRTKLGRKSHMPEETDRLVCLRNDRTHGLANGSLWTVHRVKNKIPGAIADNTVRLVVMSEDFPNAKGVDVSVREEFFQGCGNQVEWKERRGTQEFDYGYALTVHKAQGSQWDSVYVLDESGVFRDSGPRWLYTAITRAAEKITVVA